MILLTNPGSQVIISRRDPDLIFDKMFVCFDAQRVSFRSSCRPFIGVDGTRLESPFKGCLLTAATLDANSGLFLIDAGLYKGESKESWVWFLENLKEFLDIPTTRPVSLISDRGKVIIKVVLQVWPEASHMLVSFSILYGKIFDDVLNFIG